MLMFCSNVFVVINRVERARHGSVFCCDGRPHVMFLLCPEMMAKLQACSQVRARHNDLLHTPL